MNRTYLAAAMAVSLTLGGSAFAQTTGPAAPVGGPEAKGNAPLKHVHTINDGSAKPGANSFTEGQARKHMMNSGYTGVSPLAKGKDGVWRGTAMHNGAQVDVAMDFKGNVTEGAPAGPVASGAAAPSSTESSTDMAPAAPPPMSGVRGSSDTAMASSTMATHHHRRHHLRHRHGHGHCVNPGPNGAACSGIDRNRNGVSDKEDRAMRAGAHP